MMIKTDLNYKDKFKIKIEKIKSCQNLLIIGSKGFGKTVSAINYSIPDSSGQKSIFFTSEKKSKVIQKITPALSSFNILLGKSYFVFEAPNIEIENANVDDKFLENIIFGILKPINELNPNIIVFDEITNYLGFNKLENFERVFNHTLSYLQHKNIRSLFTVAYPHSKRAAEIIQILKKQFSFYLDLDENPLFELDSGNT